MIDKITVKENKVGIVMFLYWLVLVIWQNLSGAETHSTVDMALKVVLILALFVYCMRFNGKITTSSLNVYIFFVVSVLITFVIESEYNSLALVTYMYALLMVFIMLVKGGNFKISVEQYLTFLRGVILVVLYISIYAFIFCTEQYTTAFSINSAYGNELCSFLTSSHEFGMYLVAGIISAIICMNYSTGNPMKKVFYFVAIAIFFVNLILTYSRTAIVAFAIFLLFYLFSSRNDKIKYLLIVVAVALFMAYISSPKLQQFIVKTVFKDGNDAGRNELTNLALDYFKDSSFLNKIFGSGINAPRRFMEFSAGHGSVHNGYLQVLLYFGISGFAFLICFIVSRIISTHKFRKGNNYFGSIFLSLALSAVMFMLTNTSVLFFSTIDSYFLTVFYVIIPLYVQNQIKDEKNSESVVA